MEVLVCLASRPGEPVSKEAILNTVWADSFVTENVLARAISELRRAFEDNPRQPRFIETIPKRGYRLVAPLGSAERSVHETTPVVPRLPRARWFSATAATVALLIFWVLIFRGSSSTEWPTRVATASSLPTQVEAHTQGVPADTSKDRAPDSAPKVVKKGTPKIHHADPAPADPALANPALKEPPVTVVTVLNNSNVSQTEATVSSEAAAGKGAARNEALFQNISPDMARTRVKHGVLPNYPASAIQAHVTGTVEIGISVSPKGDVQSARVLIGHPLLISPALEAISQWRFEPNRVQGELTWSRMRALVRFLPDGTTAVAFAPPYLADSFGDLGAQRDELRDSAILPVIPSAD